MKETIRQNMLKKRKDMSSSEVATKSMLIKSRLSQLEEYSSAQAIFFYVSYDNEVQTHDLIKTCLASDKTVVVPKTDVKKKKLILSRLNSWDDLEKGSYSILEPKKDKICEVSLRDIQLIIVPGVAFDSQGNRIGHGKGYYDKILGSADNILKIGLAFEQQIVESIPAEKHDVLMDKIVTEKRIISCFD